MWKIVFLLLGDLLCFSQEPKDLNIKVNVNLMQIDVTVLDKSGHHVEGLTTKDFEVYSDGKRQPIQTALYVSRPPLAPNLPAQASLTAPSAPSAPSGPGGLPTLGQDRQTINTGVAGARNQLMQQIANLPQAAQQVGIDNFNRQIAANQQKFNVNPNVRALQNLTQQQQGVPANDVPPDIQAIMRKHGVGQ